MKVNKAIILAAGKGTRFYPYTRYVPKEMLPVIDEPSFGLILDEIAESGITQVCVVTSPEKRILNDYICCDEVREKGLKVSTVYQEKANGTGAALLLTREFAGGEPCAVLNGDDVVYNEKRGATGQLCDYFESDPTLIVGVQKVSREVISLYGAVDIVSENGKARVIRGIVEKPSIEEAPSLLSSLGRYIITPEIYDYLERLKPSKSGEYVFTDAINAFAADKGCRAYEFDGERYDFGNKLGYLEATVKYALRRKDLGEKFAAYLKKLDK